jgi:hypothetical protein
LSAFGPFVEGTGLCEFLGSSSLTYWKGRSVVFPFSLTNTIAWYLDLIPPIIKSKLKSVEHVFVALASYVASFTTLKNFSKYRRDYRGWIDPKLLNIGDKVARLKLPTNLDAPQRNDVFNAKLTEETHPGLVTRTQAYLKNELVVKRPQDIKKKHILRNAVSDVLRNWNKIGKGFYRDTAGTYCLGSREKIHVLEVGDFLKLRTVWIPETIDIIVGSTWFEHLKEYWGKRELFSSEIWLGHADQHLRYHRRTEFDLKFKFSYEFDGKEWETAVVSELIVYAFNIIGSCFKESQFTKNHLKFIMDTMVNKRLILHNGNTWFCNNGIPSGHSWTSIMNSLVNWIIWTSTIKNCPHIPSEIKKDYNLKIQGDDVDLDTNFPMCEEDITKVTDWMLFNFNYKATYKHNNILKADDPSALSNSTFLKRVVNEKGLIDTPPEHIWEKILSGPEYSKCRNERMVYLRRRMSDLAIFDKNNLEELSLYYAFIKHYPKMCVKTEKSLYATFFALTNGFTAPLRERWATFGDIFKTRLSDIVSTKEYYFEYFQQLYIKNFLVYDETCEYVDYWKERPKAKTVRDLLLNQECLPISYGKDSFKTLHGFTRKRRSPRKSKIMKGLGKLISF